MAATLCVLALVSSPLLWASCGALINALNPLACLDHIFVEVVNRSGSELVVTPVGRSRAGGYGRLPMLERCYPAVRSDRSGGYPVAEGRGRQFLYDADEIGLEGFAVRRSGEAWRFAEARDLQFERWPGVTTYFIGPLDELAALRPDVRAVVRKEDVDCARLFASWGGLLPLLLAIGALVAWRRVGT